MSNWNGNRFSIYTSEEETTLELIEELGKQTNHNTDSLANKTDLTGDHKGSWQGLKKPTMSEEGMRATVEKIVEEDLPTINKNITDNYNELSSSLETIVNEKMTSVNLKLDKTGGKPISDIVNNYLNGGNKYIYFSEGVYYVDKEIKISSNTIIECHENAIFFDINFRTTNKHRFFTSLNTENVHFRGGKINGNNIDYACVADGFKHESDGFDTGTAIFFNNVQYGSISNVKTKYMNESIVAKSSKNITINCCETKHGEIRTETGICLANCVNSHIKNCYVTNGGDGALYIYNGTHCSIKDSTLENTGSHTNANSGMETCSHCVIDNVHIINSQYAISIVESAKHSVVNNCLFEGCHIGVMISPYGIGIAGGDIKISNCSAIKMKKISSITLECCGFYVKYWGVTSNYISNSITFENCYFGRSDIGKALVVQVPSGVKLDNIIVNSCIFEASSYYHSDMKTYNTSEQLVIIEGVKGAVITNNIFVFTNTSIFPTPQILLTDSTNIIFSNNILKNPAGNNQLELNTGSSNNDIKNNKFQQCRSGGYKAIICSGVNNNISNNTFHMNGDIIKGLLADSNNVIIGNFAVDCESVSIFSNVALGNVKMNNYGKNGISLN